MRKRSMNTEAFKQKVLELTHGEYIVLGEYENSSVKIKIQHQSCGYIYEVRPNSFLAIGNRCPKCARRAKKTTDEFKQEVADLTNQEYIILGEYKNALTKIQIKHQVCQHVYHVIPNNFIQGQRCPKCVRKRKTTDQFKKEVTDLTQGEYLVLGRYVNSSTKIQIKHQICGSIFEMTPNNFLQGQRCSCPCCIRRKPRKTTSQFKEEVAALVGMEYQVRGEYIGALDKITMYHEKCQNTYQVRPSEFLSGSRCPWCKFKKPKSKKD